MRSIVSASCIDAYQSALRRRALLKPIIYPTSVSIGRRNSIFPRASPHPLNSVRDISIEKSSLVIARRDIQKSCEKLHGRAASKNRCELNQYGRRACPVSAAAAAQRRAAATQPAAAGGKSSVPPSIPRIQRRRRRRRALDQADRGCSLAHHGTK